MRIHVPCPSLAPHGGVRVIIDVANWLAERGHEVALHVLQGPSKEDLAYWRFSPKLRIGQPSAYPEKVLVTSPHSIHMAIPRRTVVHLQMLEHMFRPNDARWKAQCDQTYSWPGRLLSISDWNIDYLEHQHRQGLPTSYIGNGVDTQAFPIVSTPRKAAQPTVLVEGWNAYNPCKDVARLAPKICAVLQAQGVRVVAYGGQPLSDYPANADAYHVRPNLETMNRLYEEAWVLLKVSRYDARSCAPIEAMTKGTPTVRLIHRGDDDLTPSTAVVLPYESTKPETAALAVLNLLRSRKDREAYASACQEHLRMWCDWKRWGPVIEAALRDPNGHKGPLPGELPRLSNG